MSEEKLEDWTPEKSIQQMQKLRDKIDSELKVSDVEVSKLAEEWKCPHGLEQAVPSCMSKICRWFRQTHHSCPLVRLANG